MFIASNGVGGSSFLFLSLHLTLQESLGIHERSYAGSTRKLSLPFSSLLSGRSSLINPAGERSRCTFLPFLPPFLRRSGHRLVCYVFPLFSRRIGTVRNWMDTGGKIDFAMKWVQLASCVVRDALGFESVKALSQRQSEGRSAIEKDWFRPELLVSSSHNVSSSCSLTPDPGLCLHLDSRLLASLFFPAGFAFGGT